MFMFMGERKGSLHSSSLLPCKIKTPLRCSLPAQTSNSSLWKNQDYTTPFDVYPKRDAYFNKCLILA